MSDYQRTQSGLLPLGAVAAYDPTEGPTFAIYSEKKRYHATWSPLFLIWGSHNYQPTKSERIPLDSRLVAGAVILGAAQRPGYNIIDVTGTLFNDTGVPVLSKDIFYSRTGISGPWTATTILDTDPAYVWPTGTPSGQPFVVPVMISSISMIPFNLWLRMRVTF